jgi:hypothetical protein
VLRVREPLLQRIGRAMAHGTAFTIRTVAVVAMYDYSSRVAGADVGSHCDSGVRFYGRCSLV